jgi:hypothetical protein
MEQPDKISVQKPFAIESSWWSNDPLAVKRGKAGMNFLRRRGAGEYFYEIMV